MAAPTSKQLNRASAVVAAAEKLKEGLTGLQAIGYQETLDGVTLSGADLSASALAYTSGAQLDAVVAAAAQMAAFVAATNVTGTSTSIGAAIAAVCGS
jgi:2-keto-3-deoxy-L-rhamnonate aldolase RhmA